MIRRTHLSDELAEQLLTGRTTTAGDPVAAFFEDVRANARSDARPTPGLAVLLAEGLSDDKGDLLVTAASNVTGPAPQASGLPTRRKNRMIETLLAKAAAMTLGVKLAAGAGAVALAGTTAAATGNLPDLPTQATDRVEVREEAEIEEEEVEEDLEEEQVEVEVEDGDGPPEDTFGAFVQGLRENLSGAEFGAAVSEAAKTMGQEKAAEGRATGDEASEAGQANRPETTPTADANPGTPARTENQPEPAPTAGANPGTEARTENQPEPTPTADDNPGADARGGAGEEQQDEAGSQGPDAAEEGTSRRP